MNLVYDWDRSVIDMKSVEEVMEDFEFSIRIVDPAYADTIKRIQQIFENNEVLTDVFFYAFPHHEYRIVVRKDFYVDFILQLFRHGLLTRLEWQKESS
ncbi:hypothetical protein [Paenibacillus thalictri]|uniref:Uncharacterized protein n=1 Tax=Paenibacillus thalictri TaxID=2527873 RepID=A0A4Q9DX53_9BACL|nr:hypothetical protein [Paenibacillus thalictri]TBL80412.1 hypothetical protein EYB31_08330 [Paenibacillus thalictri]